MDDNEESAKGRSKRRPSKASAQQAEVEPSGMDVEKTLTDDFFLLLELSPTPQEAFSRNSYEFKLAQIWLDKLTTYVCSDIQERRLRNIYMSHLCVCLNERKLKGIFIRLPPTKLDQNATFDNSPGCSMNPAQQSQQQRRLTSALRSAQAAQYPPPNVQPANPGYMPIMATFPQQPQPQQQYQQQQQPQPQQQQQYQQQPLPQQQQQQQQINPQQQQQQQQPQFIPPMQAVALQCYGENCPGRMGAGGRDPKKSLEDTSVANALAVAAATTSALASSSTASCLIGPAFVAVSGIIEKQRSAMSTQKRLPRASNTDMHADNCSDQFLVTPRQCQASVKRRMPRNRKELAEDMEFLLESIHLELRGEATPNLNDYLEQELERYRKFLQSIKDSEYSKRTFQYKGEERSFLLLSLQNDLIKMLND